MAGSDSMSGLLEAVDEYVAIRRALGFKLEGIDRLLRDFVRFLEDRGEQRITINTAVAWAVLPGKSNALHYSRLAAVRVFATYLRGADPTVEIPGVELLPLGPQRRRPFLFSDEEIAALLDATETLKQPHRRATYRTLIGLLASTGIRVGEAAGLDRSDFDPGLGVIVVRGKLEKIRELPLDPTATQAMSAYLDRRDRPPSPAGERALFVSTWGTRLDPQRVDVTFALLRERAGIQPRGGCRPTPHGLRHTFAIRTMLDAYHHGIDAGVQLGILSMYLGHVAPENTFWYLHAAPELMSAVARRLEHYEEQNR
jgi:integrase/recombinase XerD